MSQNKKDLEIVNGDGKNLNISPVYDHIKMDKRDTKEDKNKKVVVPKKNKSENN